MAGAGEEPNSAVAGLGFLPRSVCVDFDEYGKMPAGAGAAGGAHGRRRRRCRSGCVRISARFSSSSSELVVRLCKVPNSNPDRGLLGGDECGSTSVWSWFIAGSRAQSVEQCGVGFCSLPGVDEGWTSLDKWPDTSVPGEVPSGEEEYILRGPN